MATETSEKEKKAFDIDAALNTKGFPEFMARFPDSENADMGNESEVGARFEAFQMKEKVKNNLRALFIGQIQKEMGIKLENSDLAAVDARVEDMVFNEPEGFSTLNAQLEEFEQLPKEIATMEAEVAKLGGREALETKHAEAVGKRDEAQKIMDRHWTLRLFKTGKAEKAITEADKQIETILESLDKTGQFEEVKAKLGELRRNFLSGVASLGGIAEEVQKRAQEKLINLIAAGDLKSIDQAQSDLKRMEEGSETGIDPLQNPEAYQALIDEAATEAVRNGLDQSVSKIDPKTGGALTKLESALKPFTSREAIGSLGEDGTREFLIDHLEGLLKGIPEAEKAKKFILARIIIKLKA